MLKIFLIYIWTLCFSGLPNCYAFFENSRRSIIEGIRILNIIKRTKSPKLLFSNFQKSYAKGNKKIQKNTFHHNEAMETFWENIICWRMEGLIIYLIVANSSRFIRRLPGFGLSQESLTDLRLSWIYSYNTDNNFMQACLSISMSFRMKQVPYVIHALLQQHCFRF